MDDVLFVLEGIECIEDEEEDCWLCRTMNLIGEGFRLGQINLDSRLDVYFTESYINHVDQQLLYEEVKRVIEAKKIGAVVQ